MKSDKIRISIAIFALTIELCGCGPYPRLTDYEIRSGDPKNAPIVLVATLVDDQPIARPVSSHWNLAGDDEKPHYPTVQLRQIRARVENVLRGNVDDGIASIYYFAFTETWVGHQPLGAWRLGDRKVIYAQRDHGVMRLACDGLNYCVWPVDTGSHTLQVGDSHEVFGEALAKILLTKGVGADDRAFSESLVGGARLVGARYAVPKLRVLSESSSPDIRISSCQALRQVFNLSCQHDSQ